MGAPWCSQLGIWDLRFNTKLHSLCKGFRVQKLDRSSDEFVNWTEIGWTKRCYQTKVGNTHLSNDNKLLNLYEIILSMRQKLAENFFDVCPTLMIRRRLSLRSTI